MLSPGIGLLQYLLLIEEVVTLVDDSLEATAAYRPGSCRKSEGMKV